PPPPPGAALLDAGGVQGAGGVRHGSGLHPRGLRPAGPFLLPCRPAGRGGRPRRLTRPGGRRKGNSQDRARCGRTLQRAAGATSGTAAGPTPGKRLPLPNRKPDPMKVRRFLPALLVALALSFATVAQSARETLPTTPTTEQVTAAKLVYGLLSDSRYAYRPRPIDESMPQEIFDNYLKALDGNKLFFTVQDIEEFEQFKPSLPQAIRTGNLEPAYLIFARYKQRVAERMEYARSL